MFSNYFFPYTFWEGYQQVGDARLIAKVEDQIKATQKACAKVTTAENQGKLFDSNHPEYI